MIYFFTGNFSDAGFDMEVNVVMLEIRLAENYGVGFIKVSASAGLGIMHQPRL